MTGWQSPTPEEVNDLLGGSPDWWIAGGWAIDLWIGAATRDHADLDIGCFRDDLPAVLEKLVGWEVMIAKDGILHPYSDRFPTPFHCLWCRPKGNAEWAIEILIEDRDGEQWVFRRDERIRWPAADIHLQTRGGIRFLRPEIQLLYKAKNPRERDELDLAAALPVLSAEAKAWLAGAIQTTTPSSPWRKRLDA